MKNPQPLGNKINLCKGKLLFYLYRSEQGYIHRHSSSSNEQEMNGRKKSCYEKAEECIKLLGSALDWEYIDPEGSKMLDIAILDYIRETNKLNNLKRCLLCRRKRSLMKSHIWPRSFLRRYGSSRGHDISSRIYISFHSSNPREKSPGEVAYWMLCGECEQRISQNGEDKFVSEIYDVMSSASGKDVTLPYGPWLYSFSIGLAFRTFVYYYLSATEHYLVFQQCREHLLHLPVKYKTSSTECCHDSPTKEYIAEEKQVVEIVAPIVILANPTKLSIDHPRKSMLIGALFNAGSALMSTCYLSTGKRDLSGQIHFMVIQLGSLNILLLLEASTDYCPPTGSLIKPEGGELFVPGEESRWKLIPEGLLVAIDSTATLIEETSLHHYAYKSKAGNWKSLSVEEQTPPIESKELEDKEKLLHRTLKESSSSPETSLVSGFLNRAYPSLSFLPNDMKLLQKHEYTQKGYLRLPSSHVVLLHANINLAEDSFTVFLVAKFEDGPSSLKTYVIFTECIRGVQLAYGAYISVNTDNSIQITESLIDMKKFSEHHVKRFQHYCGIVEEILPLWLKNKGFENIKVLTQRAEVTRSVKY